MKTAKQSDYRAVCAELGMDPDVHFVKITNRGTVGFTCGKPDEIRLLRYRALQAGYRITPSLRTVAR